MNKDKATSVIYHDWSPMLKALNNYQLGELFRGIYDLWDGEKPQLSPEVLPIFNFIVSKIEANEAVYAEKRAKRLENLAKANEKKLANAAQTQSECNANAEQMGGVTVTDTVTGLSKDNYKEISPNGDTKKRPFSLRDVDKVIDDYLIIRDREDIRKVIKEFFEAKKQSRKNITETGVRRNINKALAIGGDNPDTVKELFELALERGWSGIYEDNSIHKNPLEEIKGIDWMKEYGGVQ